MKVGIISGYFNPMHLGHIKMIDSAYRLCDKLYVIVNNDKQQILKKGKIIMNEIERAVIISRLQYVPDVTISIDDDETVCKTLEYLANLLSMHKLIFFNGGDRKSKKDIPETKVCKKYGIEMVFGIGGNEKTNSSTNINKLRGVE